MIEHASSRSIFLTFAVSCVLSSAASAPAGAQATNTLEVVIAGGQHAGAYKLSPDNTICLSVKARKQFSAAYRDPEALDPKMVNAVGMNVFNPDDPGPKRGHVSVTFGDPARKLTYQASIPGDSTGPLTLTRKGTSATVAFQGQTKDGVSLRMTATCASIDEF